jgi:NarL family two-component system sensor histidine kinase LiaS
LFTALAGVIGTIFGFFTARNLTRRLRNVSDVSAAWGRGDFSHPIQDSSADELGQLAGQLNAMSTQLQDYIHTRQELATADERNRLARDLHDSVKQQIFAINMNLAAVQSLWERDPQKARDRLDVTAQLARQAQQELTSLIYTLRPVQLENQGLAQALPELVSNWESQTGLKAICQVSEAVILPAEFEQTLFRVAQEALSNVARHSGAQTVQVRLESGPARVTLQVVDDGKGFDPGQTAQGVGLRSMRERMQALGGSLELTSDSGGTHLLATIPLAG